MNTLVVRRCLPGDVIASASPEFLLSTPCTTLGLRLIGTKLDPKTGQISGLNCRGAEKVHRWRETYSNGPEEFFTDSIRADAPIMALAERCFLVSRRGIEEVSLPSSRQVSKED